MSTRVIVRADDVTGPGLMRLSDWFKRHHPDVPCSAFAMATHREWDERSWRRARSMIVEYGWEFGGHTRTHPKLSQLSDDAIRAAIRDNVSDIERGLTDAGLDYSVRSFAYPCGDYDERVIQILDEFDIDCGLTYPDGFPYSSIDAVPTGRDRLRWGVTHHAKFGLGVWNDRFDRVNTNDGLYVLCIHPERWDSSLLTPLRTYLEHDVPFTTPLEALGQRFQRRLRGNDNKWGTLNEHLRYIKTTSDAEFTTFRACLGTESSTIPP